MLDHEAVWSGEKSPEGSGVEVFGGGGVQYGQTGVRGGDGGGGLGAQGIWAAVPRPRAARGLSDAPRSERARAAPTAGPWGVHVNMEEVVSVQPCADVSLPPGFGFHVALTSGKGHFFIAPSEAARESWVDALTLVRSVAAAGRAGSLMAVGPPRCRSSTCMLSRRLGIG